MTLPDGVYPGAIWRPLDYATAPPLFGYTPKRWVLHVPVGNGSLFNLFNNLRSPNRRCSTGWVSKTGVVEQYVSALREPWAQVDGNSWGTAWEFEGFPDEAMTAAQIDAAARIHIWLDADDTIADSPSSSGGIGTHQMGGAAWGGHACPGVVRAPQRADILARVATLRKPPPPPKEIDMQWTEPVALNSRDARVWGTNAGAGRPYQAGDLVPFSDMIRYPTLAREIANRQALQSAQLDALTAAVAGIAAGSPTAVAEAFAAGIAEFRAEVAKIQLTVTVGP